MSKIPHLYRQYEVGYCSPLLLANVFNDSSFLNYLKDNDFKSCGDEQWNVMINNFNQDIELVDILYINQAFGNGKLPLNLIEKVVKKKIPTDHYFPVFYYFLTVQKTSVDIWHSTAILQINNNLWYSDPYNEYIFKFTKMSELKNEFIKCNRIQTLILKENENESLAYFKGDYIFGSKIRNTLLSKIN